MARAGGPREVRVQPALGAERRPVAAGSAGARPGHRPQALLLDEPLAAVDASGRLELRRALREHLATFTGVRLIVTHDPLEAASLAERVVVLEDGRVTQDGSFGEVSARPRSAWIARMAGLNLLRGAVSERHDAAR